jgi:hypothetical protein
LPATHRVQDDCPVDVVYEPATHDVQDSVLPALDLDVPAGQTVQASTSVLAVAPAFANLPAGHRFVVNVEHDVDPARENVPDVQEPVQAAVSLDCPDAVPNLPAAHTVHDD